MLFSFSFFPWLFSLSKLMYEGTNLQSFLVGRQIFVAALMFIVARIATISIDQENGQTNIFHVSDGVQSFLDTGLLGAVILTIVGSLTWRVIASSFPVLFMSNPLIYLIIRACFLIESTGVCSAAWLLALACQTVFRFKSDDEYLVDSNVDTNKNDNTMTASSTTTINVDSLRSTFVSSRNNNRNRNRNRRSSSVVFSSRDLCINDDDDTMKTKMEKMRNSLVTSSRLSAVMTSNDLDRLMEEMGHDSNDDGNDDNDGDNNDGDGDNTDTDAKHDDEEKKSKATEEILSSEGHDNYTMLC